MKVKKTLVAALMMVAAASYGQNYIGQDYSVSPNVITTAVPFVLFLLMPVVALWAIVAWPLTLMSIPCITMLPSMFICRTNLRGDWAIALGCVIWFPI